MAAGVVRVERTWDDKDGKFESGKTRAARPTVPIASQLRRELAAHKLATGRDGRDLVFGSTSSSPFEPSTVRRRALAAWRRVQLEPIQLHESRHTFASLMITAGVNAKALSSYMGHASVSITFDRYGISCPGTRPKRQVSSTATSSPIVARLRHESWKQGNRRIAATSRVPPRGFEPRFPP